LSQFSRSNSSRSDNSSKPRSSISHRVRSRFRRSGSERPRSATIGQSKSPQIPQKPQRSHHGNTQFSAQFLHLPGYSIPSKKKGVFEDSLQYILKIEKTLSKIFFILVDIQQRILEIIQFSDNSCDISILQIRPKILFCKTLLNFR
jgi:hypothetical protein